MKQKNNILSGYSHLIYIRRNMKKLYSSQLNLIKLFAALLIVYQHVIAGFLIDPNANNFTAIIFGSILNFSRFAVTLFMIISGFLMIKSYENITLKKFYKEKFKKILVIYILACLFYSVVNCFIGPESFKSFISGILTGNSFYHLWYLNLLVKIYIVFPIIKFVVIKITKSSKWLYITIALGALQFIIIDKTWGILYSSTSPIAQLYLTYLDRSLLYWSFYFVLGGIIYKKLDVVLNFINKYKVIIVGLFVIDFIYIDYVILKPILAGGNKSYVVGSPSSTLMFPFTIISFFALFYIADLIIKRDSFKVEKGLKKGSRYILPLYIIHPFALLIISLPFLKIDKLNLNLAILIKLTLTYIISFALIWIYFKVKDKFKIGKKESLKNKDIDEKEKVTTLMKK